jgi:hypothetical protein
MHTAVSGGVIVGELPSLVSHVLEGIWCIDEWIEEMISEGTARLVDAMNMKE